LHIVSFCSYRIDLGRSVDDGRMIREDTRIWRENGGAHHSLNATMHVTVDVSFYADFILKTATTTFITGLVFHWCTR